MMKKSDQSKLRNNFLHKKEIPDDPGAEVSVIDGGNLLYQTSWIQHNTYGEVCEGNVRSVSNNFSSKSACVVIIGNTYADSTKNEKHTLRDNGKQAATVGRIGVDMNVTSTKIKIM